MGSTQARLAVQLYGGQYGVVPGQGGGPWHRHGQADMADPPRKPPWPHGCTPAALSAVLGAIAAAVGAWH